MQTTCDVTVRDLLKQLIIAGINYNYYNILFSTPTKIAIQHDKKKEPNSIRVKKRSCLLGDSVSAIKRDKVSTLNI